MSYGCFIKMYYFQFYTFCVLDPLIFFSSHMFSQAFEKAGLQEALCQRGLLARRPWLLLLKALPKTLTRPSPHFWHLLILCSCISAHASVSAGIETGHRAQLLRCFLQNIQPHWTFHEVGDVINSEGRGERSLKSLAASCHLVGTTLSTPCPPSLTPHPPSCLCQQCGHPAQGCSPGSLGHTVPFPCLAASLSNSRLARNACTLQVPWIHLVFSQYLWKSPSTSIIWCLHPLRAPGQEPLLATSGMGTSHLSGQDFCLPFSPLESN